MTPPPVFFIKKKKEGGYVESQEDINQNTQRLCKVDKIPRPFN